MKLLKKSLVLSLIACLSLCLTALSYYFAATNGISLQEEKLLLNEKTVLLYDGNGEEIKNTAALPLRQTVGISELPEHTKQAFVHTEDKRFYSHNGFDFLRIARAVLNNLKAKSFKEGASTISQQLVKNTHLTQEKTIKRKLKEWKLTRQLEKRYSKDEILERYLNTIYFGHSCFGICAASEFYFNKKPNELSLADSAILAALVKSPNRYSPFKNPARCELRKRVILKLMKENGSIDETQRQEALSTPLPVPTERNNKEYFGFVFDELTALSEKHGFQVGGNLEIRTFLDQDLQKAFERESERITECDKTLIAIDLENVGCKACVSTQPNAMRLPGSIIKPLLVYAPAIEENLLSPATPILDAKINYGGYSPENYGGAHHGYISARECLAQSLNIPAVKTLDALGVEKGCSYLEKLGLSVADEDKSLALALGGMKKGFALQDLATAFCAFPCGGEYRESGFISSLRINGVTVYEKSEKRTRVFSPETAFLTTDMLTTAAKNGTAKKLRSLPFQIAAKTGTVGGKKGNTDAYAISYTSKDCIAAWVGNADNRAIQHTGGGLPCNILLNINEYLYNDYKRKNEEISPFVTPSGIARIALDKTAYEAEHTLLRADDNAPENQLFHELFKTSEIPLNKSTSFTCPTIFPPTLSLENNKVVIRLDERSPRYLDYEITRICDREKTVVYKGGFTPLFSEYIQPNKKYIYTITPYYKTNVGKTIELPALSLNGQGKEKNDEEILDKGWWTE